MTTRPAASMNLIEASVIKNEVRKGRIIIVPSPVGARVLQDVYGVPEDSIGVLTSVWIAQGGKLDDTGMYLSMSRRQYNYYKKQEDALLADTQRP